MKGVIRLSSFLSLWTVHIVVLIYLSKGRWIEQAMSSSVEEGAKRLYNRLLGKTQTPLPDLLQRFELPKGIFPKNALNYEFNEANGKLVVLLPFICEVGYRDSSIVRFAQRVTAVLEKGKLTNIEGMKTKAYMMWMKVTSVVMDTPGGKKVTYITGSVNNKRPMEAYVVMRDGIEADVF